MQETHTNPANTPEFNKENIHNNTFQAGFGLDFIIEPFLQHFIAHQVKGTFDYTTLKLCSETHVTPQLDVVMTDRMWSVLFKEKEIEALKIKILLEHKSNPPYSVYIQILRYILEELEREEAQLTKERREAKANKQKMPRRNLLTPIVCVILYHGKQKWDGKYFEKLFGQLSPNLKRFLPNFEIIIVDLSSYSDKSILDLQAGPLGNLLLLFRHAFDSEFLENNVETLFSGLEKHAQEGGSYEHFVKTLLAYYLKLLKGTKKEKKQEIMEKIQEIRTKKRFFSVYDQIELEGIKKGKKEGKKEGFEEGLKEGEEKGAFIKERHYILAMWNSGMSFETIMQIGSISLDKLKMIITSHIGREAFEAIEKQGFNPKNHLRLSLKYDITERFIQRVVDLIQVQA